MAVRILAYTALLYQDLLRASSDPLPPVLPIVLYHGQEQWTAVEDVTGLLAPYGGFLAPFQPSQRYFLLDLGGYTGSLPAGSNLVAALIRLERGRSQDEVEAVLDALDEWLSASGNEGLGWAIGEWMQQVYLPALPQRATWLATESRREGRAMLRERVKEWTAQWLEEGRAKGLAEGQAQGRAEGQARGRVQGQAEVMRRMAARKFDAETAERLAGRLAEIADPERVGEIGEWLTECEDGGDLLDRVEGLCATSAAGDDPSRG